jgi:phenylacetate-CoA ligase
MSAMAYKDWLLQRYYRYRAWVPPRLLYHADYFRVRQLLAGAPEQQAAAAEQRLRAVLGTALAHVPFYRRSVKVSAAELANESPVDLLQRFPYLEKAQVMACQREFLDERADPAQLNYATSGGSSGQGIGLWRSKRLADIEKAFFTHEWGRFGFSFDKARILRIGADARRLAHEPPARVVGNRLMLSPYHVTAQHRAAIVEAINRFQPQYVHAYPSSAAALAELIDARQLDVRMRAVLLASEPATHRQLAAIEALFGCPVSISYGLTERTNLAFADHRQGAAGPYLFQPLYGFNENRMAGGRAEIVGTSLWNELMPLIRYRTNDYGAIDAAGVCAAIDGRGHEFLLDRGGNRIPGLSIVIDEVTWDFVRLYQIRQQRPGAITISVVARNGRLSAEQRNFVLDAQLRRWGSFFEIGLDEVADIPLSPNGKRQLVVNELAAQPAPAAR